MERSDIIARVSNTLPIAFINLADSKDQLFSMILKFFGLLISKLIADLGTFFWFEADEKKYLIEIPYL